MCSEHTIEKNFSHWCFGKSLRLVDPPRAITGLISFPGSGVVWLRHLIQISTGYMTGSVYSAPFLYKNGFPGENFDNGSTIAIQTHLDLFKPSLNRE